MRKQQPRFAVDPTFTSRRTAFRQVRATMVAGANAPSLLGRFLAFLGLV